METCSGDHLLPIGHADAKPHEIPDGKPWVTTSNQDNWNATFCEDHYPSFIASLVAAWGRSS